MIDSLSEKVTMLMAVADGWTVAVIVLASAVIYAVLYQAVVLHEMEDTANKDINALAANVICDNISIPEARAHLSRHLRRGLDFLQVAGMVAPTLACAATYGKVSCLAMVMFTGQIADVANSTAEFAVRLALTGAAVALTAVAYAGQMFEPRIALIEARFDGLLATPKPKPESKP
jgi:hypothetical protein